MSTRPKPERVAFDIIPKISGAGGQQICTLHLAQIHLPSLRFTVYGEFAAVHLAAGGQPHLALIGRTFLRHVNMVYDGGSGSVILSKPEPDRGG